MVMNIQYYFMQIALISVKLWPLKNVRDAGIGWLISPKRRHSIFWIKPQPDSSYSYNKTNEMH